MCFLTIPRTMSCIIHSPINLIKPFIYQHIGTLNYMGYSCQALFEKHSVTFRRNVSLGRKRTHK